MRCDAVRCNAVRDRSSSAAPPPCGPRPRTSLPCFRWRSASAAGGASTTAAPTPRRPAARRSSCGGRRSSRSGSRQPRHRRPPRRRPRRARNRRGLGRAGLGGRGAGREDGEEERPPAWKGGKEKPKGSPVAVAARDPVVAAGGAAVPAVGVVVVVVVVGVMVLQGRGGIAILGAEARSLWEALRAGERDRRITSTTRSTSS